MNMRWVVAALVGLAVAVVLALVLWNPEAARVGSYTSVMPAVIGGGVTALVAARKKRRSMADAVGTGAPIPRRGRVPRPMRLLFAALAALLGLGLLLWQSNKATELDELRPSGESSWLVLSLIIGVAILVFVFRTIRRDKDRLSR